MTRNELYDEYQATPVVSFLPEYTIDGSDLELPDPDSSLVLVVKRATAMQQRLQEGQLTRRDDDIYSLEHDAQSIHDILSSYLDELNQEHPKYRQAVLDWVAAEAERRECGDDCLDLIEILGDLHADLERDGEDTVLLQIVDLERKRQVASVCAADAHDMVRFAA